MPPIRRAAVTGLFALWLAPLGAMAESQSSNLSSNCSDERCSRLESFIVEDRYERRGWLEHAAFTCVHVARSSSLFSEHLHAFR